MPNISYVTTNTPNVLFRLSDGQIDAIIAAGGQITYIGDAEWVIVSATPTFPIVAGMNLLVDTRVAGVSIQLPASGTVRLGDYAGTFSTHPLILIPTTGNLINGKVQTSPSWMTVNVPGGVFTCTYVDTTVGYRCY